MSAEEKAQLAAVLAENETLKKANAQFAETQAAAKKATLHTANVAFAESLVTAGKLLPVNKDQTVALMDNLAAQESAVEFGEGEAKKSLTPLAIYKTQLEALPKIVEYKEVVAGTMVTDDKELDGAALAVKVVEFMESELAAGRVVNSAQAFERVKAQAAA